MNEDPPAPTPKAIEAAKRFLEWENGGINMSNRRSIYKYPLSVVDIQILHIPGFQKVLDVQTQKGNPCL